MVAGLVLAGFGSALSALAPELWIAILGRLMQAGGAVAGMVLARAVAQDLYGKDRSAAVIGQITAAMVVAPMVAPALSGLIVEIVGWRGIFALTAAAAMVLAVWARARLPETAPRDKREHPLKTLRAFGQIGRCRAFWAHAVFGACSLAGFLFFVGAAPYVMEQTYGARPSVYGLFFIPLQHGLRADDQPLWRTPDDHLRRQLHHCGDDNRTGGDGCRSDQPAGSDGAGVLPLDRSRVVGAEFGGRGGRLGAGSRRGGLGPARVHPVSYRGGDDPDRRLPASR
jgi:hypothetical protein